MRRETPRKALRRADPWRAPAAVRRAPRPDGEPRIGAHGKPVLFLHPKDFVGTLIEIEQA
jgi:hypothetical protein